MATYNGERFVERQLGSILSQTIPPDEVIIHDDGSTDNTASIVQGFIQSHGLEGKWKYIRNESNLGFVRNFVRCITETTGDYIFLSDQDDIFYPRKFEHIIKVMEQNKDCVLVNSGFEMIDEYNKRYKTIRSILSHNSKHKLYKLDFKQWQFVSSYPGFAMGMKSVIRERLVDYQDTDFFGHDHLIGLIALDLEGNYVYTETLSGYRMHRNNTTGGDSMLNDFTIDRRIKQKENELVELDKLTSFIEDNNFKKFDISYVELKKKALRKRIEVLQKKSIVDALKNLYKINVYPKNTLLGDLYFILKNK